MEWIERIDIYWPHQKKIFHSSGLRNNCTLQNLQTLKILYFSSLACEMHLLLEKSKISKLCISRLRPVKCIYYWKNRKSQNSRKSQNYVFHVSGLWNPSTIEKIENLKIMYFTSPACEMRLLLEKSKISKFSKLWKLCISRLRPVKCLYHINNRHILKNLKIMYFTSPACEMHLLLKKSKISKFYISHPRPVKYVYYWKNRKSQNSTFHVPGLWNASTIGKIENLKILENLKIMYFTSPACEIRLLLKKSKISKLCISRLRPVKCVYYWKNRKSQNYVFHVSGLWNASTIGKIENLKILKIMKVMYFTSPACEMPLPY